MTNYFASKTKILHADSCWVISNEKIPAIPSEGAFFHRNANNRIPILLTSLPTACQIIEKWIYLGFIKLDGVMFAVFPQCVDSPPGFFQNWLKRIVDSRSLWYL
jgi:hypothetical protein